jgi:Zn-dependent protease with chaperone function
MIRPAIPFALGLFFLAYTLPDAGLGKFFQQLLKPVVKVSEQAIGAVVAQSVKLQYGVFDADPEATEWVRGVFNRIVAVSERKDIRFKITLLRPDFVNAFAAPGGHIFITRGLLQRVKSDDELAGVLGHEVGHVVAQHSMKSIKHQLVYQYIIRKLGKRSNKLETMGQIYSVFSGLRYSRKNELESDYIGARYAAAAGYNPEGMVGFLKVLKSLEHHNPSRIETSLRSHPPSARRIERISAYVAEFSSEIQKRKMNLGYNFAKKHPIKKKGKGSGKDSQPSSPSLTPTLVYSQEFDSNSNVPGIARGLKRTQDRGVFILDRGVKHSGKASQRISTFGKKKSLALATETIPVKPSSRYRVRGFIKTYQVLAAEDPLGSGAFFNLQELSSRAFLKAHQGIARQVGSTKGFIELRYEFETRKDTSSIVLEWVLRKASGKAWFDDFVLEKLGTSP